MATSDSILISTKEICGIAEDYDAFDTDIITFINSAFFTLHQLGVGPTSGFSITDDKTSWSDYSSDQKVIDAVKPYIFFKVRIGFDPPTSSYVLTSMENQIKELEWRLNVLAEGSFDG